MTRTKDFFARGGQTPKANNLRARSIGTCNKRFSSMMVRYFVLAAALTMPLLASVAIADQYNVTAGWTDPTAYNPGDAPAYELRYRVAGGAETVIPDLTSPAASFNVTANPGDPIDVQVRALNLGLEGPLSAWVTATASYPVTAPANQTDINITVVRTGS